MKDRSSKRLATLQAELDKQRAGTPRQRRMMAKILEHLNDYPFNGREPLFCWLWANHTLVADMRQRWDAIGWDSIAQVAALDGIKGSRGEPPNANSTRRVWGRVCREVEEDRKRKVVPRDPWRRG